MKPEDMSPELQEKVKACMKCGWKSFTFDG